eukprot:jgi/Botrbrau1/5821/Bobra.0366s0007.1
MAPAAMLMIRTPSVIPRTLTHRARAARTASLKPYAATKAEPTLVATSKDEFRCRVTEEGTLVCERLEPGNYKIQGMTAADKPAKEGTVSFCYVLDDGSVVCEDIPSGDYAITKATDDDLKAMVEHASKLAGVPVVSFD